MNVRIVKWILKGEISIDANFGPTYQVKIRYLFTIQYLLCTANAYRQMTDKLMFKSVISTVRRIRKQDIVICPFNKQNMLIFNQSFVFYPKNVLSKMKSHIRVKITFVCLQNLHFPAKFQTICKNNTYFSVNFTRAHFLKHGVDGC